MKPIDEARIAIGISGICLIFLSLYFGYFFLLIMAAGLFVTALDHVAGILVGVLLIGLGIYLMAVV